MLYTIRVPLIVLYFLLVAALGTIACLVRPFNPDNTRIFAHIYSWLGIRLLGMKLTVTKSENQNKDKPAVYIVNHQDNFDLFVCGAAVPKRTVTVGKKSLKYLPLFGQLYWLAGNVFIDRKNKSSSSATLEASTHALQQKNTSIWVFAEGTRNRGENMLPFKNGAFKMAIEAQVPIIPICVSSYAKHLNLNKWHSGDVLIQTLPPLSTQGLNTEDLEALKEQCWNQMMKTIEEMDLKISNQETISKKTQPIDTQQNI